MIIGVDYASVDGNMSPDWSAIANACRKAGSMLGFAIIRGAYGTMLDSTIGRDWNRARAAGLTTGAYLYLRLKQSPVDQVHVFADNVGELTSKDFPPFIDVEDNGVTAEEELRIVSAAWDEMVKIYGVSPAVYTSNRVWTEDLKNLPPGRIKDSPLWLAKPWPWAVRSQARLAFDERLYLPAVPAPWGDQKCWWIHQYQGDAYPCPGFSNTVDLSRFHLMRLGEAGDRVKWVQHRLHMTPTGVFGRSTLDVLVEFQSEHGLVPDGVIGPKTFAALCWSRCDPDAPRAVQG